MTFEYAHARPASLVLALCLASHDADAQEPVRSEGASATQSTSTPSWIEQLPIPVEPKGLPAEPPGLCQDKPGGLAWLDRMQAGLYRGMCLTAARFDGFFGNARF